MVVRRRNRGRKQTMGVIGNSAVALEERGCVEGSMIVIKESKASQVT
jgi:hypothetical protein